MTTASGTLNRTYSQNGTHLQSPKPPNWHYWIAVTLIVAAAGAMVYAIMGI